MPPYYVSSGSTGRQRTLYCQGASTKLMLRPSDKKYNYIIVVVQWSTQRIQTCRLIILSLITYRYSINQGQWLSLHTTAHVQTRVVIKISNTLPWKPKRLPFWENFANLKNFNVFSYSAAHYVAKRILNTWFACFQWSFPPVSVVCVNHSSFSTRYSFYIGLFISRVSESLSNMLIFYL
jgi:hypothetical protein